MADSSWNSVSLLLPFDGADGSTTFTDYSPKIKTVTRAGNVEIDTAQSKYGGASALFDGTTDSIVVASSAEFNPYNDFTCEAWVRLSSFTSNPYLFGGYADATHRWALQVTDTGLLQTFIANLTGAANATTATLTTGTWYHIAYTGSGGNLKIFLDGVSVFDGTPSRAFYNANHNLEIGAAVFNSSSNSLNGWLDDIRFTRTRRYTAAFTPPTDAFPLGPEGSAAGTATASAAGAATGILGRAVTAVGTSTVAAAGSAQTNSVGAAAGAATASGVGYASVSVSALFAVENLILVSVGCPFHVNIEAAVSTITVPFHVGPYIKTISVPFHVNVPTAVATISCPFHVYGDLSTQAGSSFVQWRPKVVLDGTDISAKLIGALEIEADEMASVVASFSFIPTAGSVDPLAWVGKTVTISWQRLLGGVLTNTVLRFTGVVSDPTWDADERILSINATSDLQGRLDRMTKAEIDALLTSVSPTYSEYVFGPAEDLSGWEYAQALISTTNAVLWQDQAAVIQATSTLAKATADYTFTVDDIIAGSLGDSPQYPSRQELTNKIDIDFSYRFARRRQRQITCRFQDYRLDTAATYLSGTLGGWKLPQRTQIESAANGGGWAVVGDIKYADVWPSGFVEVQWNETTKILVGWVNNLSVTQELCVGATWKAARRWLQTVTETATLTVQSTESQAAIGILADNEIYSIEDEATDEEWESSLEYDDYATGAVVMSNGVDKRADLDELRDEFETAQEVAISKARNDILRAHRGTTVTFSAPFLPALNLSHTVAVDTAYLDCKGKVRRITDSWNLGSGDCISTVTVALFRHNGAGLVSGTMVAAVEKAADPTEDTPRALLDLKLYIGGRADMPLWSSVKEESGYFVNLPSSNDTDPGISGYWDVNPLNPQVAPRIYEEGFAVAYPTIDEQYVDPSDATTTATFEVAVPEDTLTLISG